jgi:triosephosphate isomerase (TIM)
MSKLVIGNWKANKTPREVETWFEAFSLAAKKTSLQHQVALAPAFPLLPLVSEKIKKFNSAQLSLAVQDLSSYPPGSYTGAVPAYTLLDYAVRYAIVGHSERRRYFHETDQDVARKVEQALENGITPIVCIDQDYLRSQAAALAPEYLLRCIVAYEPLGAIGTGSNADVGLVKEVMAEAREVFGEVKVIYGGSVDEFNVAEYLLVCDGVLVGGSSLDGQKFARVCQVSEMSSL